MKIHHAQISLAGVFLIAFLCNSGAVLFTYVDGSIYADNLRAVLLTLLTVYSAPLAIVIGGVFGQRNHELKDAPRTTFWFAIAVALVWNFLLVSRSITFAVAAEDSVEELSTYLETISSSATFLVAGALAYFFAKRA